MLLFADSGGKQSRQGRGESSESVCDCAFSEAEGEIQGKVLYTLFGDEL